MICKEENPDPEFVRTFGANEETGGCSDRHGVGTTKFMCQGPYTGDTCVSIGDPVFVRRMYSDKETFKSCLISLYESQMGRGSFARHGAFFTFLKFEDGVPTQFILSLG